MRPWRFLEPAECMGTPLGRLEQVDDLFRLIGLLDRDKVEGREGGVPPRFPWTFQPLLE